MASVMPDLPSLTASPHIDWYQIILLSVRGIRLWTT